jgi:hypothetical protein
MPVIPLSAADFPPGSVPNGSTDLNAAWSELVWAAITVGKRDLFDVVRHGPYSFFEIAYRSAILFANLRQRGDGYLERSAVYEGQDPSEKAATSYFLGLTCAKLVAERCLTVPWLMHLDVYRHRIAIVLTGRSRPDLVGQNGVGEWVVMESKGRTRTYDPGAMAQAKAQTQQISTIAGAIPVLYSAVQVHFGGDVLEVEWRDPSPDENARIDLDISSVDLRTAYYRPFIQMLEQRAEAAAVVVVDQREFQTIALPDADLMIGVDIETLTPARFTREPTRRVVEGRTTIGSDGILVKLGPSWSEENMQLEPQARVPPV